MEVVQGRATVEDTDEQRSPDARSSPTHESVNAFVERLGEIGEAHGVAVQAFDARYVVGRTHLERAVELAERAFARDDTVARDPAVEVLLYAAGRRQIDRALEMGVGEGSQPVVAVVFSFDDGGDPAGAADAVADLLAPAETLGGYDTERVRTFFDVGDRELAATDATLADLVRERVALLTVEK